MVDISKLANPPAAHRQGRSVLDDWVDNLNDTERTAVLGAVRDRAWGHVALLNVLIEEGAPEVAATTFQTWRRKMGLER